MSDNVFRFSVKKGNDDSDKLVDMNAVAEVVRLSKEAMEAGKRLEQELAAQDTENSYKNGLKAFIREQIEAAAQDGQTRHVQVLDEEALADLIIEKGREYVEVKCEYHLGKDNWKACKDLAVIYINGEQPNFDAIKEQVLAHGIKKVEATFSKAEQCQSLTEVMQLESKITGNPAAVFFPHAYNKAQAIKLVQLNGVISAKAWAKVGGAVALSSNFIDVLTGEKTPKEAAKDIVTSAAKEILLDYAKHQVLAVAVNQPFAQAAIRLGAQNALGKSGLAVANSANAFAVSVANKALLTSAGLATEAIGTAGGFAAGLASSAGLTGTAGVITAGTAGLTGLIGAGAAMVSPLMPLAVGGAAVYGVSKLLKKIF